MNAYAYIKLLNFFSSSSIITSQSLYVMRLSVVESIN